MRALLTAAVVALLPQLSVAQDGSIVLPEGNFGNYDPTLSAKEAVLANWEMAASGVRAGAVLGGQIVDLADKGATYDRLSNQAQFALKTMVSRYSAAAWLFYQAPDAAALEDDALISLVAASTRECSEACEGAAQDIRATFAIATTQLSAATEAARSQISSRQDGRDADLLAEQLGIIATYLESGAWAEDLVLTEFGMDTAVVADRLVGALSMWRNIEPYVGLTDQEIDNAINTASSNLLRTLRRDTRGVERLDPDGQIVSDLKVAASTLGFEFRRASALFSS
ncbi:MAG: hypothetical protein AAFR53_03295 [Pseudomonadota bacterium]